MNPTTRPVVVITGASGHVGQAVARQLAGTAKLVLLDQHASEVRSELADAELHRFDALDVGDARQVESALHSARDQLGPISALVHTVGGYSPDTEGVQESAALARRMLELNYLSAVTMAQAVLPHMLAAQAGTIVLFGSATAIKARARNGAYAASKAALLRYAEALADEVTPRGVRVRVLLPTTIDTPVNRQAMPKARVENWVTLPQIAQTVAFLIDPASAGIRYAAIALGR